MEEEQGQEGAYSQHPCSVLNFLGIRFHISVVESRSIMHVNSVIIFQMHSKKLDVTSNRTVSSSIGTAVRSIFTALLMLELSIVWKYIVAA